MVANNGDVVRMGLMALPAELLLRVVWWLPVKTQASVAQVCRELRTLLADGSLVRLQVARFHQRIALRRPVEPELLPFVRSMSLPAVEVATTVLRQIGRAPAGQLDTVVFNVPSASAWAPVFDALRDIATVRVVRFDGCDLAAWDCRGLAQLVQVEALEFEACPDMPAGLLPTVAALPQLRRLVVSDAHLFASTDANTMSRLARLEELRLSGYAALSDSGMAQIGQLTSLRTLDLDGCQGLADQCLRQLGPLPALQRINLSRCHFVTDASVQHLAQVAPQLRHVDVSHCFRISDVGFAILAHLPHLTELSAQECARLSPRGLIALARTAPRLQLLDLRLCTEVTDENITDMLAVMDAVVQLLAANDDAGSASLPPPLAASQQHQQLVHPLSEMMAPPAPAAQPASPTVRVPLELQTLRLGYSHAVSDRSLRVVADAAPNLVELDVANCRLLTNTGLESVTALRKLKRLNLSRCVQITDEGIARLTQCKNLTELNVSFCEYITDAALLHLSSLPALKVLDISGCGRLTYPGLVPLARLRDLKILRGSPP